MLTKKECTLISRINISSVYRIDRIFAFCWVRSVIIKASSTYYLPQSIMGVFSWNLFTGIGQYQYYGNERVFGSHYRLHQHEMLDPWKGITFSFHPWERSHERFFFWKLSESDSSIKNRKLWLEFSSFFSANRTLNFELIPLSLCLRLRLLTLLWAYYFPVVIRWLSLN